MNFNQGGNPSRQQYAGADRGESMSAMATPGGFDVSASDTKNIPYQDSQGNVVPNHPKPHHFIPHFPDPTIIFDKRMSIIAWNPAMEAFTGISAGEVLGRATDRYVATIYGMRRPTLAELAMTPDSAIEKRLGIERHGDVVEGALVFHDVSSGAGKTVSVKAGPIRDCDGLIIGAVESLRDISKFRSTETTAHQSEEKYRQLVENIRDVIFTVDRSGVVTSISPAIKAVIGYSPEEIMGRHCAEFVHREDLQRLRNRFDTTRSEVLQDMGQEYRLMPRHGDTRWVLFSCRPIHENDAVVGYSGILSDVTERKEKEKTLCEREELYRTLTENVNEGVVLYVDRKILFANGSFSALMDCSDAEEIIGGSAHAFVRDDYKVKLQNRIRELEGGVCGKNRFRGPCITKSGREIWVDARHNRIQWNGRPAVLATIRDITEDRRRVVAVKREAGNLKQENIRLRSFMKDRYRLDDIIGKSPAMQSVYEIIYRAAESDAPVIIYGESGTGKELVARAVHRMSVRRDGAFVPVNCGAIPENLLESEFFGHKKGAFTGATINKSGYLDVSDGGSLFLDEVGEISLNMQVKLLRAIEGNGYSPLGSSEIKTSNVRIIAATNRRLIDLIQDGSMREDFFYRIHILPISVPPLRKRKDDIPLLVEHFLQKYGCDKPAHGIPGRVMDALFAYDWPGNVRELENVLNRYVTFRQLDFIHVASEPAGDCRHTSADAVETAGETENDEVVHAPGKDVILNVLHKNQWHRARAASELGISRNTLYRRMKRYGINHW